jgi:hypothetical protein
MKNNKVYFRILDILGIDYDKNKRIIAVCPKPILENNINKEEEW